MLPVQAHVLAQEQALPVSAHVLAQEQVLPVQAHVMVRNLPANRMHLKGWIVAGLLPVQRVREAKPAARHFPAVAVPVVVAVPMVVPVVVVAVPVVVVVVVEDDNF